VTIFLKLGGSLITDKTKTRVFRQKILSNIVTEIKILATQFPDLSWIVGHGSGSFGHVEAKKYDTANGVVSEDQWLGFSKVSHVASELNQLVWSEFVRQDVPAIKFQPSASLVVNDGVVQSMEVSSIKTALEHHLIPLIHGDVGFDKLIGGTIVSTEMLFQYLISHIKAEKIILLGEVDGVLDDDGQVIPEITPQTFDFIKAHLHGSRGVDVTGGMYQKVYDMLQIIEQNPETQVIIANGQTKNVLRKIFEYDSTVGTKILNT